MTTPLHKFRSGLDRAGGRRLRLLLLVAVPLALTTVGVYLYVMSGRYVSTEDAYIKADKVYVAAEVSGKVAAVAVRENQPVSAGQPLFRLDDKSYRIALDDANAKLALVQNGLRALQTAYREKQAELARARADIAYFQREYQRRERLAARALVSRAALDEARHNVETARLRALAAQRALEQVQAELGGDANQPIDQYPRYAEAKALRDQAALNLARTMVFAPIPGIVGPHHVQPGDFVTAGVPVLSLVSLHPYVEANIKETDLAQVRVGETATVRVDAYPDRTWQATVVSISPATGSDFSVLPAQNASGNWVKVVQRVPIRLALRAAPGAPPLRSGMTVSIEIDTRSPARVAAPPAGPSEALGTQ